MGILEKGEVSDGAAAATCGRRNCLHLFSSPPPPVDARLGKGSEDSAFLLTTPLPQWVHPSLSLCGEQKQFRLFSPGKYKTTCGVGWQRLYIRHHINFNLSENLLNLMWVFGCLRLFPHKVTMTITGCP